MSIILPLKDIIVNFWLLAIFVNLIFILNKIAFLIYIFTINIFMLIYFYYAVILLIVHNFIISNVTTAYQSELDPMMCFVITVYNILKVNFSVNIYDLKTVRIFCFENMEDSRTIGNFAAY